MGRTRSRLVALAALAVLLVVIAAGAATSSNQSSASKVDGPAAVDVLTVTLTLFGFVVAGLAAYMVWSLINTMQMRRGRGSENGERARLMTHIGAVATAFVILTVIVALAWHFGVTAKHPQGGLGGTLAAQRLPASKPIAYSAGAGAVTAIVVAVAVAAILAVPRLRRLARRGSAPDFAILGDRELAVLEFGSRQAAEALAEVRVPSPEDEPDPRRAIVAAWIAMTASIAVQWRPRHDHEAPREYLSLALEAAGVGPAAADRLTGLFERARFGGRSADESMRAEAIDALRAVRDELEVPV